MRLLTLAARHGRLLLVGGLVAGLVLQDLAQAMRPWLPALVAGLIFLAAFRIGHRQAFMALAELPALAATVLAFQVGVPVAVALAANASGLAGTPIAIALTLMTAAPSVAGSPNLTVMAGGDPAPALRLVIAGTAALPLTVIPVFLIAPGLGGSAGLLFVSLRLMAIIAAAAALAFWLRSRVMPAPGNEAIRAVDGASAILMAVVVIGLMAAAGPALLAEPARFFSWLAVAFIANFGLQLVAGRVLRNRADRTPLSIVAGNRNIALFLIALPPEVTGSILLFIGCYQMPMYLTPLLMSWYYRRSDSGA